MEKFILYSLIFLLCACKVQTKKSMVATLQEIDHTLQHKTLKSDDIKTLRVKLDEYVTTLNNSKAAPKRKLDPVVTLQGNLISLELALKEGGSEIEPIKCVDSGPITAASYEVEWGELPKHINKGKLNKAYINNLLHFDTLNLNFQKKLLESLDLNTRQQFKALGNLPSIVQNQGFYISQSLEQHEEIMIQQRNIEIRDLRSRASVQTKKSLLVFRNIR